MNRRSTGTFLLLCALFFLTPRPAAAQHAQPEDSSLYRAAQSFYVKGRLGGNFYGGDRDRNPPNNLFDTPFAYFQNNQIGVSFGLEAGYHFTENFSLGLLYLSGNYPRIKDDLDEHGVPYLGPFYGVIDPALTSTRRRHVTVLGRSYMMPHRRVSPYGQLGFHLSFGTINGQNRTGAGPAAGIGLDTWVSPRLGIFLELNGLFALNDRALDLADTRSKTVDASDFDAFTYFGFGIRYTWRKPPTVPIRVACTGPHRLTPDEMGTFAALINEDATRPISYRWHFGDGSTPSEASMTTHAFEKPDTTFTVTVTAFNREHIASAQCPVSVIEPPLPRTETPELAFKIDCTGPSRLNLNETGTFTAHVMGDTAQTVIYDWDFKDGYTYSTPNPQASHAFSQPDTFTVTVTASTDTLKATATCRPTVSVFCNPQDLKAIFFDHNSSEVTQTPRGALIENLIQINQLRHECPTLEVLIEGYVSADECTPDYRPYDDEDTCRQELACRRAYAIKRFYVNPEGASYRHLAERSSTGIPAARIRLVSPGIEQCPIYFHHP